VISLAKGIEQDSLKRMTEVVVDVAPGSSRPVGVLTGPNLAREVLAGHPAASVVGLADEGIACELQQLFSSGTFRVYTNPDVIGCEIAGALKNVIAIAAGMTDGMGFGDNTRAALITRGLAELTRLGIAIGGDPLTFSGLAGMGDLVATCISRQSRNRHVGEALGQGRVIDEIVAEMRMVAEGVKTSGPVVEMATRHGVEMPIAEQVAAVISDGKTVPEAITDLMQREAKTELYGIRG
jgi:glycerol-3-phosphate dehydrogenase (NAD(P)+)